MIRNLQTTVGLWDEVASWINWRSL